MYTTGGHDITACASTKLRPWIMDILNSLTTEREREREWVRLDPTARYKVKSLCLTGNIFPPYTFLVPPRYAIRAIYFLVTLKYKEDPEECQDTLYVLVRLHHLRYTFLMPSHTRLMQRGDKMHLTTHDKDVELSYNVLILHRINKHLSCAP